MFNAAAERVFRWPRGAVMGQPLDMLIPERFRASHRRTSSSSAPPATRRAAWARRRAARAARRRQEFPIEASISQHIEDGRKLFTVILRDMTERVRAEAHARAQRGAPARHPRLRDGRDHHRGRAASTSCSSTRRPRRCSAARASEAIGAPLDWFIPERFRARAPPSTSALRRDRRRPRGAWATRAWCGPAAQRRGVPDRGLDLAGAPRAGSASTP